MSRIHIPSVDQSLPAAKPLLAAVQQQLGVVPNLMKLLGTSPPALEGYLALNGALAKGRLGVGLRERVALAVAEYNGCDYCLSAHTYLATHVGGMTDIEVQAARAATAQDAPTAAVLAFARRVVESRGQVSDADLAAVRAAGVDDASLLEIVAAVALNVLTNYVNNVAQTAIDFPVVTAGLRPMRAAA